MTATTLTKKIFFFRVWTNGGTQMSSLMELTPDEVWAETKMTQSHVSCYTCDTLEEAIKLREKLVLEY